MVWERCRGLSTPAQSQRSFVVGRGDRLGVYFYVKQLPLLTLLPTSGESVRPPAAQRSIRRCHLLLATEDWIDVLSSTVFHPLSLPRSTAWATIPPKMSEYSGNRFAKA